MTLRRMDQLCEILDDPRVPMGAVIQPSGVVPASRIEQAARKRLTGGRRQISTQARQQRLANTPGAEASEFAARQPEGD